MKLENRLEEKKGVTGANKTKGTDKFITIA